MRLNPELRVPHLLLDLKLPDLFKAHGRAVGLLLGQRAATFKPCSPSRERHPRSKTTLNVPERPREVKEYTDTHFTNRARCTFTQRLSQHIRLVFRLPALWCNTSGPLPHVCTDNKSMQMIKVSALPCSDGSQNSKRRQSSQIVLSTAMYSLWFPPAGQQRSSIQPDKRYNDIHMLESAFLFGGA